MKTISQILAIILLFIGVYSTTGQTKSNVNTNNTVQNNLGKVNLYAGMNSFEGIYDKSKVTELQLKNTWDLINNLSNYTDLESQLRLMYLKPENLKNINTESLKKEYSEKINQLKKLDIIKSIFWEDLREDVLKEIEQEFTYTETIIQSFKNPEKLKQYDSLNVCAKFTDALLKGGEQLLITWKELNQEQQKNNACPECVIKEFNQKYNSPNKLDYARIEVVTFGWGNCITLKSYVPDWKLLDAEFRKIFIKINDNAGI
ncbi:MAG: hypothetical protein ABSD71_00275 [Bacteroidales bacterium]